jgi:putative ABC transport system substrate-binding protein
MRRIGVLIPYAESDAESQAEVAAFRQQLQQLGWRDGRNVRIEVRWGGGEAERIRTLAKELVALQPDVILGRTTPVVAALVQETRTTPIVFVNVVDPVGPGFVASVARPGGNITGFTNFEPSLGGKYVELLTELSTKVNRIGLMFNPKTAAPFIEPFLRSAEQAASSFKVAQVPTPVQNSVEIESAIEALAREPGGGLALCRTPPPRTTAR